jgi:hypothetical protein
MNHLIKYQCTHFHEFTVLIMLDLSRYYTYNCNHSIVFIYIKKDSNDNKFTCVNWALHQEDSFWLKPTFDLNQDHFLTDFLFHLQPKTKGHI